MIAASAMNRDANKILAAAEGLLEMIEQFQKDYHEGTLETELRLAKLLGKREHLTGHLANLAWNWLEDAGGLIWMLEMFTSLFSAEVYRVPDAPNGDESSHNPVLKPR